MKVNEYVEKYEPKDIRIRIEDICHNELMCKICDKYDPDWPNDPITWTINQIFDTDFSYKKDYHTLDMPYEEFCVKCPYAEKTISRWEVESVQQDGSSITLILKDLV